MINHIVLFKLKPDLPQGHGYMFHKSVLELERLIPEILSMSGGQNTSSEGFDKGFDLGYTMLFESTSTLKTYLTSFAHEEFVKDQVSYFADDVLVFDYNFEAP